MSVPRLIKKYPNRRLYDTGICRYIDLADIRALVADGTDFIVIDKQSGRDITRETLLLVIATVGTEPSPVMSKSFLLELIRAHGTSRHAGVSNVLDETVRRFA
ncbi:MAG: polyhydroxyalkanoate synthesis regulator DNA-binding domain-containing protein [Steroidobacteraceae bacterium]